jgi:hypothetical protein
LSNKKSCNFAARAARFNEPFRAISHCTNIRQTDRQMALSWEDKSLAGFLFCRREGVIVNRIRSENGGEYGGHQDGVAYWGKVALQSTCSIAFAEQTALFMNLILTITPS